jgi:acetyltransferase-like isoleucine patch superfamily enzyme
MYVFDLYCKIEFWFLRKLRLKKFKKVWKNTCIKYWFYGDSTSIRIWNDVYIWESCHFWWAWGISIWEWSIIASWVIIRSSNHDYKTWDFIPFWPWIEKREVNIWANCWIWANVLITPGTQIWEWSIVWFWAVLSWKYPPCSIIVWNPWKVIKMRNEKNYEKLKMDKKIYWKHFNY